MGNRVIVFYDYVIDYLKRLLIVIVFEYKIIWNFFSNRNLDYDYYRAKNEYDSFLTLFDKNVYTFSVSFLYLFAFLNVVFILGEGKGVHVLTKKRMPAFFKFVMVSYLLAGT